MEHWISDEDRKLLDEHNRAIEERLKEPGARRSFLIPYVPGAGPIARPDMSLNSRYSFLKALQIEKPEFWRTLKSVCAGGDQESVVKWMLQVGIRDDWFVQVIWDTIEYWRKHPNSAAAEFVTGTNWFWYKFIDEGQFQVPRFVPDLERPIAVMENGKPEPLTAFKARMESQFNSQLADYVRYLKDLLDDGRHHQVNHARWAAAHFMGDSFTTIASREPSLRLSRKNGLRPDNTVKVAVHRFNKKIGLTGDSQTDG